MSGRAQLVIPVLDVSDSVIGAGGADPRGRSFEETRYLARHLAHHRCSPKDRLGAVIFAEGVVELEPTPLTSLSIIEAALRRPPAHEIGSGTRLDKALEAAARMAGRFPSHESTVVVLSDMVVDDIDGVARALRRLGPTAPHLVALGDHDAHMDALFASVVELGEASRGEVAIALNEAVASARKSR